MNMLNGGDDSSPAGRGSTRKFLAKQNTLRENEVRDFLHNQRLQLIQNEFT